MSSFIGEHTFLRRAPDLWNLEKGKIEAEVKLLKRNILLPHRRTVASEAKSMSQPAPVVSHTIIDLIGRLLR